MFGRNDVAEVVLSGAIGVGGTLCRGRVAVAEVPEVVVAVLRGVLKVDGVGFAAFQRVHARVEVGQGLVVDVDAYRVACGAVDFPFLVCHGHGVQCRGTHHTACFHGVGILAERLPGKDIVSVGVSVFGIEQQCLDVAKHGVVAKGGCGCPYGPDSCGGVPFAAEFVVDAYVDGEIAGGVVGRDDGTRVGALLDIKSAPAAKVEVAVGRVGLPDDAVDAYLVFASATGADAAEVERPAKDPAVVNLPVVAYLYFPFTIKRTADEFVEVRSRNIIIST